MRARSVAILALVWFPIFILNGCVLAQSPPPVTPDAACQSSLAPPSTVLPESLGTSMPDLYADARDEMVDVQLVLRDVTGPAVLDAMRTVPRHRFVPADLVSQAYADHPLPIGFGQTISQPFIVTLMTESLLLEPGDRALEVGTGSGCQAAVLAQLGVEVYTMEIVPQLATRAVIMLAELHYANVHVENRDGYYGWPEHAPYDAIIVTAAPDHLPQPLAGQLREGGRLVIPIGPQGSYQPLWLFEKVAGELQAKNLGPVRFVPFTGEGGG